MEELAGTFLLHFFIFCSAQWGSWADHSSSAWTSAGGPAFSLPFHSSHRHYKSFSILPLKMDPSLHSGARMQSFGDATGLRINLEKSSVAAIQCQGIDLDSYWQPSRGSGLVFQSLTWVYRSSLEGYGWHISSRCRTRRLRRWLAGSASYLTRGVLVRSVLSSLPVYLLTVMKPPKKFIKNFDKVRRSFLWAGNQQLHDGKCKVSWARLQRPIKRGGLGITNLEFFNRALRLRWLWFQWKYPDRPWREWSYQLTRLISLCLLQQRE
jgi:hypothetical protein